MNIPKTRALFLTLPAVMLLVLFSGFSTWAQGPTRQVNLTSSWDTFLRSGIPNVNEGANEFMRVRRSGKNRALVGFDLTGVSLNGLSQATLVLTIQETANNWGPTGRLVNVHSLLEPWNEGNGSNMSTKPTTRGIGVGATWHCAADGEIRNHRADCARRWKGGNFALATAQGVVHTKGMTGQVAWDVTEDVLAGAEFGWIIRKEKENKNGRVKYYSREGAAAIENPNAAPRLILEFGGNRRPLAHAGSDQTVDMAETVKLEGSGSTDTDGDRLTFNWTLLERPSESTAILSDPSAVRPSFVVDEPGTYVAELIVNDGTVDSAPDTVVISTENSAPVAHAGPDQTVTVTQPALLNGTNSHDVDGDPLTYRWSFVSVPFGSTATLSDPISPTPGFTPDLEGRYVLKLVVNDGIEDSEGDTAVIDTQNSRPVADPGQDQDVAPGLIVSLNGKTSNDVDGDPLTYRWSLIAMPGGSKAILSDPITMAPTFEVDVNGVYVAQLIVHDGLWDSEPVTVAVIADNSPPVADVGPDQTVPIGTTVTLDGSGSNDADDDPLTFRWLVTDRPVGSTAVLSDPTAMSPDVCAGSSGLLCSGTGGQRWKR